MLQTVQRIGPVLDLFTPEHPEWGVSEVARALDLPRSSAHSLLSSLVDTGILGLRGRGRYRIGWRIVELHASLNSGPNLRSCAAPILADTSRRIGETLHLAVLERDKVLYLDKAVADRTVTVMGAKIGSRLDPHCSAVGKVLLAFAADDVVDRVCAAPMRRLTPATMTNPAVLRRELDTIRTQGFALDKGEIIADVHCVAAPVRDDTGSVVAALSTTVPTSRFAARGAELRTAVLGAAAAVSAALRSAARTADAGPADWIAVRGEVADPGAP